MKKLTLDDCVKLAKSNGGFCLSRIYKNTSMKMMWKCSCGFVWSTKYSHIQQGHWCPKCSGHAKSSLEEAKGIAFKLGGKCLSENFKYMNDKLLWECVKGHQWYAKYSNVKYLNRWCSKCKLGKTQEKLFCIVKEIFPNSEVFLNYKGFDWLRGKRNRKMEIDIFVKDEKLAIEYDGRQHFIPIRKFGGKREYDKTVCRDKRKNVLMKNNKQDINYFIRFNYKNKIDKDFVLEKIKEVLNRGNEQI